MRHAAIKPSFLALLATAASTSALLLVATDWAGAQAQESARDDLKQRAMEKIKRDRNEKSPRNNAGAPRPASRAGDVANPIAAAMRPSEVDSILNKELAEAGRALSPIAKDEDFLRRVYVDLTGKPPTPDKLDTFVRNSDPAKRAKVIDALLDSDDYARNWARYWRDVVMYHSLDPRARIVAQKAEDWFAEQIRNNVHWDRIATELITATGPVAESGTSLLIFSQFDGTPENVPSNVAAEATRVFMGIQISCAQCHDHPYDEWKREQFHEMAAFFARTTVFRDPNAGPISFEVRSKDDLVRERGPLAKAVAKKAGPRFALEHRMPDKEDPEKSHTMHPQFLLGQKPSQGLSDAERRALFASYVTDKNNPWFARAYVNRIWAELMGEGFYEPVDDLGPGREARFPALVHRLSSAWRASDYDMKWLFRLIMNTEAYQREIRPRDPSAESTPFAAVCPTRLSADQIYDSLLTALGIDERALNGMVAAAPQGRRFASFGPRGAFTTAFGVDPSLPTDEVQGTIPQALFMMNGPLVASQIRAQGDTLLGRLISVYENDEELVRLLYKRVLARMPTQNESNTCLEYIKEVDNRHEAFEDLLWSLLNSTEFITKR